MVSTAAMQTPELLTGFASSSLSWLLTYALHSTVLIVGVWLVTTLVPKINLGVKETLWRVALFGGIATATMTMVVPGAAVLGSVAMPEALGVDAAPAEPVAHATPPGPRVIEHEIVSHTGAVRVTAVREAPAVPPPVAVAVPAPSPAGTPWPWIIMGLYAFGVVVALGRLAYSARRLYRQLHERRDVIEDPVLETFLSLCQKVGLAKRPRLTASAHLRSPVALWRWEICLPDRAVDSLHPKQQEGMLAHELAHLIRRDPTWLLVAAVVESVLFFQPLNLLARRKLQEIAEYQCDDWAARKVGTGVHLAKCLAEVAAWTDGAGHRTPTIVAPMTRGGSPIVRRITRLLANRRPITGRPAWHIGLTLGALGLAVLLIPDVTRAQASPPVATVASAPQVARHLSIEALGGDDDRSHLRLQVDDQTVRLKVEHPKPPPPAPVPPVVLAPPPSNFHAEFWIDIRDEDDFEAEFGIELHGLDALLDGVMFDDPFLEGFFDGAVHHWHHDRIRERVRRHHRAEVPVAPSAVPPAAPPAPAGLLRL